MLCDPEGNIFYVDRRNIKKYFKFKDLDIKNYYQYTNAM